MNNILVLYPNGKKKKKKKSKNAMSTGGCVRGRMLEDLTLPIETWHLSVEDVMIRSALIAL